MAFQFFGRIKVQAMNTITPAGGIVRSIVPLPQFRMQAHKSNEPEDWGSIRSMAVEDAAVEAALALRGARCLAAATRIASDHVLQFIRLKRAPAWGFAPCEREIEAIALAEKLFGVGHPEAACEFSRLRALPCEPRDDEVFWGLFNALRWAVNPVNIVCFGVSRDQGLYL